MLKFLYIGDIHETENIPSSRIDDFKETVHKKRKEILQIAKTNQVNAILQGGDFFDRPKVSNDFLTFLLTEWGMNQLLIRDTLLNIHLGKASLSDLSSHIENSIPIIGIIGNHDLIGGAIESYDKTSLSILQESGLINIVSKNNPFIFKDEEISVCITGSSYNFQIDEDKENYIIRNKSHDYHIHLAHGMLMNKSYGKMFKHTLIQDIALETKADLTINGHDHTGYPLTKINDKLFINPGSIVRMSATKKEFKRMPKVLLISVSKETGLQVDEIPLNCAEKGENVLTRKHITDKLELLHSKIKIEEIVKNVKVNKGRNLNKIIENIGNSEGLDKDIIDDCTGRIQNMQLRIEPEANPNPDYVIQTLELENFLSHKHSFFDFSKDINILTGKSRAGKSAVLRAIKELQECYLVNPRKAIFQNEEFFRITVTLSNGFIISRYVENKKKGKNLNGYSIYNPNTNTTDFYNTKALPEIQKLFKFQPLKITDKKTVNTNFMMQGEGWFFTTNLSAQDRAKLVGYSYGAHIADAVVKEVNSEAKDCNSYIKKNEKLLLEKNNQIKSYDYLQELKIKLDTLKELQNKISTLNKNLELAKSLFEKKVNIEKKIIAYENISVELTKNKVIIQEKLEQIKELNGKVNEANKKWEESLRILKVGKLLKKYSKKFSKLDIIKDKLQELKEEKFLYDKSYKKGTELLKKRNSLYKNINLMESLQVSFNKLNSISITEITNLNNKIKEIQLLYEKLDKILKSGKELKIQYEKQSKNTVTLKETLSNELRKLGTCPVCHSILNEDKINEILN